MANYGKNNSALSFLGNDSLETTARNIGLQLNIPLFQGGYVNSKTREAAANRSAAQATLENTKRTAALNARQSYLGVVNGLAQVRALNAALISSTSALESNKLGYEVGVRINIDVPVSYTHLDVYKRQDQVHAPEAIAKPFVSIACSALLCSAGVFDRSDAGLSGCTDQ